MIRPDGPLERSLLHQSIPAGKASRDEFKIWRLSMTRLYSGLATVILAASL